MKTTPLRQQYLDIKQRYADVIVFFRLGDFYETFDDDARTVSRELEITLTSREMGKGIRVPLAGIPYHALDNYLGRLISRGYKVAICEQLSEPGKGLVDRDVVRIVTPGTVVEPNLLKDKNNNYLAGIITDNETAGISYIDISTGEFVTSQMPLADVADEVARIQPAELIISQNLDFSLVSPGITVTRLDAELFSFEVAQRLLTAHFKVGNLEPFGCENMPFAARAAGAILGYLTQTQKMGLGSIKNLSTYSPRSFMTVDAQTRRNLEVFANLRQGTVSNSLLSVIDMTRTAMGGRLLKKWLSQPLIDLALLNYRHICIGYFLDNGVLRAKTSSLLNSISDLERLINRIKNNIAFPRELIALSSALKKIPEMKSLLQEAGIPELFYSSLKDCGTIVSLVESSITDIPEAKLENGNVIKAGFSDELDGLKNISGEAKSYLKNLEQKERERTGIKSLKVLYNRVFGYYIEVSKSNLGLIPADYIRKQTLVSSERFYTPELKEYELTILNAHDKTVELEGALFRQVCFQIAENSSLIHEIAASIAEIDVITSFAEAAAKYGYCRPELNNGGVVIIKEGRHPVVERSIGVDCFIPNDTLLDNEDTQVIILTGPNMSGKSTYLRQVALIVMMAQVGCYVPAKSASIGLVDRIFTRIGAQEDLAAGQSTFMVEMVETANILNNATPRSLVILDEVGRGTSTYDGMSIAWATVEFIHNNPRIKAKTLFATHYHELIDLTQSLSRVKNFNVAVSEDHGKVTFLHKIIPGGADKSYGIHVAQLAGIPAAVINRAREVLSTLEKSGAATGPAKLNKSSSQLPLFNGGQEVLEDIARLDIDSMTPLDAINTLYRLKSKARGKLEGN
jgi:DNA mismatch repair protein MutS